MCAVKGGANCHQTSYLQFSRFNLSLFLRLHFFITHLTLVGDLLMGDPDVVKVFESLGGLAQGEAKVDMESQAEPHDMCVMAAKAEGRSILRKGV